MLKTEHIKSLNEQFSMMRFKSKIIWTFTFERRLKNLTFYFLPLIWDRPLSFQAISSKMIPPHTNSSTHKTTHSLFPLCHFPAVITLAIIFTNGRNNALKSDVVYDWMGWKYQHSVIVSVSFLRCLPCDFPPCACCFLFLFFWKQGWGHAGSAWPLMKPQTLGLLWNCYGNRVYVFWKGFQGVIPVGNCLDFFSSTHIFLS